MDRKPRIVVVGSSNLDLVMRIHRVPEAGETLTGGKFVTASGGKGANQAVALARLGAEVEFVGRVGTDPFGDILVRSLDSSGVSTRFVTRDPAHPTGTVVILVDDNGDNAMVTDYGANGYLAPADVDRAADVLSRAELVLLQCEVEEALNRHVIALAERQRVPVILNPALNPPADFELLKKAHLLTPNRAELEALAAGCGFVPQAGEDVFERTRRAADRLREAGVARLVVTLGRDGSYLSAPEGRRRFEAFEVRQVDATGAGDVFTAALAFGLAGGKSLEEAIRYAAAAAAVTVTRLGAQPSFPTYREVEEFLASHDPP